MIRYEKYWLRRIISVQAIVSVDYVEGCMSAMYDHTHQDAWELVYVCDGQAQVRKNGETISLCRDQMILLCPGIHHDLQIDDHQAKTFVMSFSCSNDGYLLSVQNTVLDAQCAMRPLIDAMILELIETFAAKSQTLHLYRFVPDAHSPLGAEQMICCYLEQFLILLLRQTAIGATGTSAEQFHKAFKTYLTDRVTEYIRENLTTQLTVQQIAEHFHYSRARLSALYKDATGVGINEAVTNIRIQQAKDMLRNSQKSVADIAEELGFSSAQYFSYKFTKVVGVPPSKYTKK